VIRVLLVDDQDLLRAGYRMILSGEQDIEIVGEAADGAEAVSIARATTPDVVVMDVRMPRMDGIEATRRMLLEPDPPAVLVLTTFDLDEYVIDALRAGASAFLLKDLNAARLAEAVRTVHRGEALLAPGATRRLLDRFAGQEPARPELLDGLTERELDVLRLLAQGATNGEIASALVVAEGTVKTHVGRLLEKLQARDRVQLVLIARRAGIS
jgi:DNA-binding NarL/FixJ family response regulator